MRTYTYDPTQKSAFAKMAEAFIIPPDRSTPRLPLAEYIETSGLHGMAKNAGAYEKSSLDMHNHYYAKWVFPNGREVTAISGQLFHCDPERPYEVWLRSTDSEPIGWQTDEDLMKLLIQEMLK